MLELDLREAGFEAMELYFQIDALRREIDAMRMKRMTRESTNFAAAQTRRSSAGRGT